MKNQLFLISLFFVSAVQAEETFVSKKFAWKYTVTAKDSAHLDDICKFNAEMRTLIDEVKRGNNPAVYQNFLNFVQQVQEAIAAGLNLYGTVQTQEETIGAESVSEVIETMIEEAIEQVAVQEVGDVVVAENEAAVDNAVTSDASSTEVVDDMYASAEQPAAGDNDVTVTVVDNGPAISIAIVFVINDASQTEAWNSAIARLQALADAMNNNTLNASEVVCEIDAVYNILQGLQVADIALAAI